MVYAVSDMAARKTYMVATDDIRPWLHEWAGQATDKFYSYIDFVADFYTGKHNYREQTIDAEEYLGICIICTGRNC